MSLGNHILTTASASTTNQESLDHENNQEHNPRFRDIHALTLPPPINHRPLGQPWETSSHAPSLSTGSFDGGSIETNIYSTMSREFNALALAGSTTGNNGSEADHNSIFMGIIGEEEEMNPLAIVPDTSNHADPQSSPWRAARGSVSLMNGVVGGDHMSVHGVKKGEVEMKILAWQNAKIAMITNRFKREDAIIQGWEDEQIQKASSQMKKVERKLEEKRARAQEKMENEIAKAHRKAEERKASAEARRGTKVAKVFEIAHLTKAMGKAPPKRFF